MASFMNQRFWTEILKVQFLLDAENKGYHNIFLEMVSEQINQAI